MDRNSTGTIDWWEFVNYEAVKVLGRRDKVSYYTTRLSTVFHFVGSVKILKLQSVSVNILYKILTYIVG